MAMPRNYPLSYQLLLAAKRFLFLIVQRKYRLVAILGTSSSADRISVSSAGLIMQSELDTAVFH